MQVSVTTMRLCMSIVNSSEDTFEDLLCARSSLKGWGYRAVANKSNRFLPFWNLLSNGVGDR